jgi:hypothetical protein
MSQQTGILDRTFKASIDLDTKQYYIVKMETSSTPYGVTLPTSAAHSAAQTNVLIGILQNKPKQGEAAVVRIAGTSKVKCSTPMSIGALITSGTPAGQAMVAETDKDWVIGTLLETVSAADDIAEILITGFKASI